MSDAAAPPADWYPDPSGRFQYRYWDGATWTGHVSTEGQTSWDPPEGEEEPAEEAAGAEADFPASEPSAVRQAEPSAVRPAEPTAEPLAPEFATAEPPAAEPAVEPPAEPAYAEPEAAPELEPEPILEQPVSTATTDLGSAWAPDATSAAPEPEAAPLPASEPSYDELGEGPMEDANDAAVEQSGVANDVADWLHKVSAQVGPRLTRINGRWEAGAQAEAARACAFGLLLGHLAMLYPHMRADLSQVAETHASFSTLDTGNRLTTLEQIAAEPARAAAWLGPLIDAEDPDRVKMLFD